MYVICLNTTSNINNSLINLRTVCHPLRILSDTFFHSNSKGDLALPVSMMPKKVYNLIKRKKIDRKISKLRDIANLRFFINKTIRKHPNKIMSNDILFPDNNVAARCSTIIKINNGMLKFLFLKFSKI